MYKKFKEKSALIKELNKTQDLFVHYVLQINFGSVEDLLFNTEQAIHYDKQIKDLINV